MVQAGSKCDLFLVTSSPKTNLNILFTVAENIIVSTSTRVILYEMYASLILFI